MKKLITIALFGLLAASFAGSGVLASPLSLDTLILKYFVFQDKATGRYYVKPVKDGTDVDTSTPVNPPPVADAGQDTVLSQGVHTYILDGSGSYGQGGATITSYSWTQTAGTTTAINSPNTDTTTISGLTVSGNYVYSLTVTDNNGLTATSSVTVTVPSLPSYRYLIQKGAKFFFSPTVKTINGYTGVIGDPSDSIVTATDDSTGWTVSTVGPDTTLWNPDPLLGDVSATTNGMQNTTPVDPWGYDEFDSSAMTTGFVNYSSQYVPGTYNLKISGLDPLKKYQIKITGSFTQTDSTALNVYDSRTLYYFSGGTNHSLNTNYTTSKYIVADTLTPDSNGDIFASVTGQDSTYSEGSIGVLSAMKIYELSKDTGTGTTDLYKYYYDTAWVYDGTRERLCVVYKPYNFNPDSSYPILLYLNGAESAVKDYDNFDPEIATMDGLGTSLQHYKGEIYGRKANGDTASFVMLIPEFTLDDISYDTGVIGHLITNFKAQEAGTYHLNDSLFIAGFSRGAMRAIAYALYNPSKVTAVYMSSPLMQGTSAPPISLVQDSLPKFSTYGTKLWVVRRTDASSVFTDSLIKYASADIPDNFYYTYWDREHSGFAWEWTMDTTNNITYNQTPYDWFYNPSRYGVKMARFVFQTSGTPPSGINNIAGKPVSSILSKTDSNTGWTLSSVSTTKWGGFAGSVTHLAAYDPLYQYPKYVWRQSFINGWQNTKTGGYATNGANLKITGLTANHSYTIYWGGSGDTTEQDIGIMTWGSETTINNGSHPLYYRDQPLSMTGTSESDGTISLGFYPSTDGSGTAWISYLYIKEN